MSEDEKKLLKIFKAQVEKEETEYFSVNAYTQLLYDSHKFILRLIDKQHKEIDRLQEENKALKEQLSYAVNTNNKDILENWRKK